MNESWLRPGRLWLATAIFSALLFTAFPRIDLWVSGLLWSPDSGFFLAGWPPFRFAYAVMPIVTWTLVAALLATLAVAGMAELPRARRWSLFLLLNIALGPGLLTNTILKDHWGRARPAQIVEFGGTKAFTPALEPAAQCARNCSFVAGHSAMAFSLIGFAFLPASLRRRRLAAAGTLGFGAFVSAARIAQGGHFLSDTVFAGLIATGTAWLLHHWIVEARGLDRPGFGRFGRTLLAGAQTLCTIAVVSRWRRWLAFDLACAAAIGISAVWIDIPLAVHFHAPDDRLTAWLRGISDLGLGAPWLIVSGAATILLVAIGRTPRFAVARERFAAWALVPGFVFLAVALSGLVADLTKILVGRTRPKLYFLDGSFAWTGLTGRADHWSFPSGHTANVTALVLALYFIWPRHAVAYGLFVALIALSRVGLGQHYLSDTIGGGWIAVLVTFYLRGVVLRRGLTFADAKAGVMAPLPRVPWYHLLAPWHSGSP
jgi:lipid A 4'-phosphatase